MIATIQMIVSGNPDRRRQGVDADEREREPVHPDAGTGRHGRRDDLTRELPVPRKAAEVVDDADGDGDRGAEQQPARLMADVEEGERRHEHPEEQTDPAEARHRQLVDAPPTGDVDHAEPARHPSHRRRQQNDDGEGDERSPEDLEVIAELVEDAEVRADRREHADSVLRRPSRLACDE